MIQLRLMILIALVGSSPGLAGGNRHDPPPIHIDAVFDPAQIAWSREAGTATLTGSAALRTRGGDVKSCGGLEIELIPLSDYAAERMRNIYGTGDRGMVTSSRQMETPVPGYLDTIKKTTCDAQGAFQFDHLPAGAYFLVSQIGWALPGYYGTSGATMMRKVDIKQGDSQRIVLPS